MRTTVFILLFFLGGICYGQSWPEKPNALTPEGQRTGEWIIFFNKSFQPIEPETSSPPFTEFSIT